MKLIFIGTSSCIPDIGSETASFVINDRHLVDTGWSSVLNMKKYGLDPLKLRSVILTHLHQDHYIGLAQLLFYIGLRGAKDAEPFNIYGPKGHLEKIVKSAFSYLQTDRFPELAFEHRIFPLDPGDSFEIDGLQFHTWSAKHVSGVNITEEALCYKVMEASTKAILTFTGDTSFHPPIAEFARKAKVLIHDSAHTSPADAARTANMAQVDKLLLIHYPHSNEEKILNEAREIFSNTFPTKDGDVLEII
jgi:ribonuclease Z